MRCLTQRLTQADGCKLDPGQTGERWAPSTAASACRGKTESARLALKESLAEYPCNWAAWKALHRVCAEWEDVINLEIPASFAREFFFIEVCMTLHWSGEALSRMAALNETFPRSAWLVVKAGTAHYTMRKMEEAKVCFES